MQQALKLNPRVHFNWHEYAVTLMYLHRYEEANRAVKQARVIDPDSFWGKTTQARIAIQERGDTDTAVKLTIGAQHGDDYGYFETYMQVNMLAGRYEDALETARNLPGDLEVQHGQINLKEDWAAQTLHFMGDVDGARQAAAAALFRLKGMRAELGEDYRLDIAEARIRALQGAASEEVRALVQKSISSIPPDEIAEFEIRFAHARIFSIAGMASEAIEVLDPLFKPPSTVSVYLLDLDPAFDAIRNDPEFTAMMERSR
jgi:tetratricopeptide (TPR) repeat protein